MKKILLIIGGLFLLLFCGLLGIAIIPDDEPQTETTSSNSKVISVNEKEFNQKIINTQNDEILCNNPSIVDFNATWCGPCKMLSPILENVQTKYGDKLQIYSVDVDQCNNIALYYKIESIPSLLYINPKTKQTKMMVGLVSRDEIENTIKNMFNL